MLKHQFGGNWTDDKLVCLEKYIKAYRNLFSKNLKASYFTTHYVDAFAGTGYINKTEKRPTTSNLAFPWADEDVEEAILYSKGSAQISLGIESPFHHYWFIEKNAEYIKELEKLKQEFPKLADNIQIRCADANEFLMPWCRDMDWTRNRAVVFLDPYGMQVEWSLIESIAKTKAIDLWLLFPIGIGVNRLLRNDGKISDAWGQAMTRIFGDEGWRTEFYKPVLQTNFLDDYDNICKDTNFDKIGRYFIQRLKSVFRRVVDEPLQLCNSKNNPMYLLCFASGADVGSDKAVKIAGEIIGKVKRKK